ncbi:MAG: sigma factor-like helix-turn-helix DNA-binding protein [Butyribacter sp.]|nr:sigma factor-like helix-turn-helix DNA-binding protein [bacterium]MDY3854751.1 sigma factor-like helix-turn-helix DNA-binding protein [Butyribacter sp.]
MEKKGAEAEIEERVELSILYDFYGALLKENQQRMFEASILEDYNFAEIAEEEGISRQGAYDAIKRAIKQLRGYEEKLGLVAKFQKQKVLVQKLRKELAQTDIKENEKQWQMISEILEEILDDEE